MRKRSIGLVAVFALWMTAGVLGIATPASASTEDCVQCQHLDCIKGNIKRKTAMANGYEALATKWGAKVTQAGKPMLLLDIGKISDPAAQKRARDDMLRLHEQFGDEENALSEQVGPASGCSYSPGAEVGTETYWSCIVDTDALGKAIQESPCKQLGDLLATHEGMHRDECLIRRARTDVGPYWRDTITYADGSTVVRAYPPLMPTPVERAQSEARAYRKEVAELKKLLPKAQAKCELSFNDVTISCTIPTPPVGVAEMGQDISGKACGDPLTATWKINTVSWVRAPYVGLNRNIDPPWENDCVAKGSPEEARRAQVLSAGPAAGWMCVYDDSDPPKIIIRNFRLKQCSPNTEQTITVDAKRSDCDETPPEPPPVTDLPVS